MKFVKLKKGFGFYAVKCWFCDRAVVQVLRVARVISEKGHTALYKINVFECVALCKIRLALKGYALRPSNEMDRM